MNTVFLCENSAAIAFETLCGQGFTPPASCRFVRVPCAGSLKKTDILDGLREKGSRVLVAGCHAENCRFVHGNKRTSRRVDSLRADMEALAIGPGRLKMEPVSAVEHARLRELIADFIKD